MLGAVAINQLECGKPWTNWIWWIVVAFFLVALCWGLLKYAKKNTQKHLLYIKEFERRDQEMLTFLFIYLLPFVRSKHSTLPKRSMRPILKGRLTDEFSWPLENSHSGSTRCGEELNKVADLVH